MRRVQMSLFSRCFYIMPPLKKLINNLKFCNLNIKIKALNIIISFCTCKKIIQQFNFYLIVIKSFANTMM